MPDPLIDIDDAVVCRWAGDTVIGRVIAIRGDLGVVVQARYWDGSNVEMPFDDAVAARVGMWTKVGWWWWGRDWRFEAVTPRGLETYSPSPKRHMEG